MTALASQLRQRSREWRRSRSDNRFDHQHQHGLNVDLTGQVSVLRLRRWNEKGRVQIEFFEHIYLAGLLPHTWSTALRDAAMLRYVERTIGQLDVGHATKATMLRCRRICLIPVLPEIISL